MRRVIPLISKDIKTYFYSPVAYIVIAASLLLNGWNFWFIAQILNNPNTQTIGSIMQFFFGGTFYFWLQILLLCPVITMRLFSEEHKSGTIETLMTAPVSDMEVVLSKFLASLFFYTIMWLPTVVYMIILKKYAAIDVGPVLTGYMGLFLVGGLFLSIGLMMSSLTKNQIVAAVCGFAACAIFFSLTFLGAVWTGPVARAFLSYISILEHFEDFRKGVVDTRPLLFYTTMIAFHLFITIRIVESRKWR